MKKQRIPGPLLKYVRVNYYLGREHLKKKGKSDLRGENIDTVHGIHDLTDLAAHKESVVTLQLTASVAHSGLGNRI